MSDTNQNNASKAAYPIPVQFTGAVAATGSILRITPMGIQFETLSPVKPKDRLRLKWELPTNYKVCEVDALVVKIYERFASRINKEPVTLVEAHFREQTIEFNTLINTFLAKIGSQ
ncbi:MAG: hypothetical protein KDD25_09340 [Bdellovibrionales bacterium]|nr:hypothetical protein [Bdellovibrionales bacterium]